VRAQWPLCDGGPATFNERRALLSCATALEVAIMRDCDEGVAMEGGLMARRWSEVEAGMSDSDPATTRAERIVHAAHVAYAAHRTEGVMADGVDRARAEERAREASLEALWEAVRSRS
jgi:hypothetical protein